MLLKRILRGVSEQHLRMRIRKLRASNPTHQTGCASQQNRPLDFRFGSILLKKAS